MRCENCVNDATLLVDDYLNDVGDEVERWLCDECYNAYGRSFLSVSSRDLQNEEYLKLHYWDVPTTVQRMAEVIKSGGALGYYRQDNIKHYTHCYVVTDDGKTEQRVSPLVALTLIVEMELEEIPYLDYDGELEDGLVCYQYSASNCPTI